MRECGEDNTFLANYKLPKVQQLSAPPVQEIICKTNKERKPDFSRNKQWPQYIATFIALMTVFTSGMLFGWPSPSLPKLLSTDYNMTIEDASYTATLPFVGNIAGNILSCLIVDIIGRKMTLLLIGPIHILSMFLVHSLRISLVMLYAGRIIGGIAEGICLTVIPIYVCEISEPKIRGALSSFSLLFWFSGVLLINVLGTRCSIEITSLITMAFPSLFFIVFATMPESPYYFLMKNKVKEATTCLKRLRHRNSVDEELSKLTADVQRQMSEKGTLRDLFFIRSNRTALTITFTLKALEIFSGIAALNFYGQLFFREATDVIPEDWAVVTTLLIKMMMTMIVISIVDIVGRKTLLLISTFCCFLTLTFLGTFFLVRDYSSLDFSAIGWIPLFGMILFTISFVLGLGVVVNCLCGELFSATVKAKGNCLVNTAYALSVFVSTKLYQSLTDRVSFGLPLLIFGFIQILGFFYCLKCVPETKKKSLEKIQLDFKRQETQRTVHCSRV